MGELLLQTGHYLMSSAIRRMLTGAGLTLTSTAVSATILQSLIDDFREQLNNMPDLALALIDLSGTDIALSLMMSAILTRHALTSAQLYLTRINDATS